MAYNKTKLESFNQVTGGLSDSAPIYSIYYKGGIADLETGSTGFAEDLAERDVKAGDFMFLRTTDTPGAGYIVIDSSVPPKASIKLFAEKA